MTMRQQQQQQHGADESAGVQETIYSSDGLPSIVLPLAPPPLPPIGVGDQDDDTKNINDGSNYDDVGRDAMIIETHSADPRAAFNVFRDNDVDLSTGPNSPYHRSPRPTINDVPSSTMTCAVWEDPRRRLFRLRAEIESLEHAFATEKKEEVNAIDKSNSADEAAAVTASELKSRIDALLPGEDFVSMLRGRQEALSSVIARDMDRLAAGNHDNVGVEGVEDTGSTQGGGDNNDGVGKIVYELYRECGGSSKTNKGATPTSSSNAPQEIALEERLRKLELAVGSSFPSSSMTGSSSSSSSSNNNVNKSILQRVEEAEQLVREVDSTAIDKLAARAKVVRADLEAAARAKSKLATSSRSVGGGSKEQQQQQKEDFKTIAELHTKMHELDGISSHLPALTSRLLELSTLHANAADFASRLEAAESALRRSESTLSSVERALTTMEGKWDENMKVVEKNVVKLDRLLSTKVDMNE
jgi:hypothetical protein